MTQHFLKYVATSFVSKGPPTENGVRSKVMNIGMFNLRKTQILFSQILSKQTGKTKYTSILNLNVCL